jgi:hypothetical protein
MFKQFSLRKEVLETLGFFWNYYYIEINEICSQGHESQLTAINKGQLQAA